MDRDIRKYDDQVAVLEAGFGKMPVSPSDKEWVKLKLAHMVEVDQYMRNFSSNTPYEQGYSENEKNEFTKKFETRWTTLDLNNTADLKDLLKIYPWFTIGEFGKTADSQAWLLVQHADLDPSFQQSVLSILDLLWRKGETNPANFAYLFDRVAVSWGDLSKRKLQRYGTQGTCTGPGIWEPLPMEEPARIDERRVAVGLESMADYIQRFKDICH